MNRIIYNQIAQEFGVSTEEIEREIQTVIDDAYISPNSFARDITYDGQKPTIEEFILSIVKMLQS